MIKHLAKILLPAPMRRKLRKVQVMLNQQLQCIFYQVWIFKYDRQHIKNTQALNNQFTAVTQKNSTLAADAIWQINQFLEQHPDTDLVYTDSDQITHFGIRKSPYFKTDWDPYLFLSQNYFEPFYVIRKNLLPKNGLLPTNLYACKIRHLPKILCHSRTPFKVKTPEKPLIFKTPAPAPLISIIIPTKDGLSLLKPCIESILSKNENVNFEILIVNNNSQKPETHQYFKQIQNHQIRILDYPHPFNYSAINNFAVTQAKGEVLLLLNNDIEALSENSLMQMLSLVLQADVGIVGAKLLYPNQTIQHAGIVLGIDTTSRHILTGFNQNAPGYFGNLQLIHCCSAVTAACLMIQKSVYEKVGGLDEKRFPITFNDIDLCLKVREQGYRIVYTPHAEFYHKESATRGEDMSPEKRLRVKQETAAFIQRWGSCLEHDPFYNLNLSLSNNSYTLAFPPRNI